MSITSTRAATTGRYRNPRRPAGSISFRPVPQTRTTRRPPATTKAAGPSPLWVPVLMFSLLGTGVAVIVGNYFGLLVGGQNNWFLLVGIVEVTLGFIVATMLR